MTLLEASGDSTLQGQYLRALGEGAGEAPWVLWEVYGHGSHVLRRQKFPEYSLCDSSVASGKLNVGRRGRFHLWRAGRGAGAAHSAP